MTNLRQTELQKAVIDTYTDHFDGKSADWVVCFQSSTFYTEVIQHLTVSAEDSTFAVLPGEVCWALLQARKAGLIKVGCSREVVGSGTAN